MEQEHSGDAAKPHPFALAVTAAAIAGGVAVVIVFDPLAALVGAIDLSWVPLPDLPDRHRLPTWLHFLLGPGKLIILAVIFALAAAGESERRRNRGDDGDGDSA